MGIRPELAMTQPARRADNSLYCLLSHFPLSRGNAAPASPQAWCVKEYNARAPGLRSQGIAKPFAVLIIAAGPQDERPEAARKPAGGGLLIFCRPLAGGVALERSSARLVFFLLLDHFGEQPLAAAAIFGGVTLTIGQ